MIGALAGVCGVLGAGGLAAGALLPNARLFGPVVGRGAPDGRSVYLTFDDGPSPRATPSILDTLALEGAPATFFMVGRYAESHPELARAVASAGHLVGSHTYTHRKLTLLGPATVRREIGEGHRAVARAAGVEPEAFRAPHGHRNPFVDRTLRGMGCPLVGWTLGVWDSDRPGADEIRRRARSGMRPGTVLLLHDGDGYDPDGDRSQTAEALPGILDDLRRDGYAVRPLAELLA
ncbi:MAG: polysaccharide deacetylase family protein [Candidatus Palauibacterales bacterium]|nr:polysaccharide deacetylase family protein [Candidatus Palauibacterales bacterium]MDP2528865.1 polysaccharide deacetylase family protein [Candidatus Palauibacterales bacterium]